MKRYLVFAYGSNMSKQQIRWRAPSAIVLGVGTTKGYKLGFVGRGVATLLPASNSEVPGVLYSLNFEDFKSLHAFEGWPYVYDCKLRPVHTDRGVKIAWTYIHNSQEPAVPEDSYFFRVLTGAEDNRLDDAHIWAAYEESRLNAKPRNSVLDDWITRNWE